MGNVFDQFDEVKPSRMQQSPQVNAGLTGSALPPDTTMPRDARFAMSDDPVQHAGNVFDQFDSPDDDLKALNDLSPSQAKEILSNPPNVARTMLRNLRRAGGLTTRDVITGLSLPVSLTADVAVGTVNRLAGTNAPLPSQHLQDTMTAYGLPQPEGKGERLMSDITTGVSGGALAGPAGLIPGATSGLASGLAREAGAPPIGQVAAGLVGGVSPSTIRAAGTAAAATPRVAAAAIRPLYEGGRQIVVGKALRDLSTNPKAAQAALGNAPEYIPGSRPTTGVASGDPGLLSAERYLRNTQPNEFAQIDSANNTARNAAFDGMAGTPDDITRAKASRDAKAGRIRDEAFANKQPTDPTPIHQKIDAVLASPKGKREAVQKALAWAKERIGTETDPENLYAIRQDINDAMQGKFDSDKPALRLAKAELHDVKMELDAAIEKGAPRFNDYIAEYRDSSGPINQAETMQDIRTRTQGNIPDPMTGEIPLSQAKWSNVVRKQMPDLKKQLSSDHIEMIERLTADLDRGAAINSPMVRASGSDTIQNLTTGNILGSMLGKRASNPAFNTMLRPLAWIYKLPEEAQQRLLVDAMRDPQMAKMMMGKAEKARFAAIDFGLKKRARAMGYSKVVGTVAGSNTGTQQKR